MILKCVSIFFTSQDWGFEFDCVPSERRLTALRKSKGDDGLVDYDSTALTLNEAKRLSVKGYYHATVVFDESCVLVEDEVLEFFSSEPTTGNER